ncbi:MAG: DUF2203 family protein [Sandaracinaceae bacterium]
MSRTFTLSEANSRIPDVASVLARTTLLLGRARAIARQLADLGVVGTPPGELPDLDAVRGRPSLEAHLVQAWMLRRTAFEEAARLERTGVVIRDLERGWIGFRSVIDGEREVLLSWHLGEREIQHFHPVNGTLIDRRPVTGHRFFRSRQLGAPR